MFEESYKSETLVQDSVHGYISITSPTADRQPGETAYERDLVDSPWLQRLRQIHQLQTAWFVYPTAEHSRFQHVLGTACAASRVWNEWQDGFYRVFQERPDLLRGESEDSRRPVPSRYCVESLLRVAGLLHDVGHGPFGHFFDDHFNYRFKTPTGERLTHETLGAEIVRRRLADIISGIRRSPSGVFAQGEKLDPEDVVFLIVRPQGGAADERKPYWLRMLRSLFSGLYTVDNIDFVLRDAYASGFSSKPFDLERLLHYSFFSPSGLTIHKKGAPTLQRFLNARAELFQSVYFHRTVRAIDVELADLFKESADLLYPYGNPIDSLDEYLRFTDWSLITDVGSWDRSDDPKKRAAAPKWRALLDRRISWRMIAEKTVLVREGDKEEASIFADPEFFETALRKRLPDGLRELPLRFDIARHAIRPDAASTRNFLYDPETCSVMKLTEDPGFKASPKAFRICRVYGLSADGRAEIIEAFNKLTSSAGPDDLTNV